MLASAVKTTLAVACPEFATVVVKVVVPQLVVVGAVVPTRVQEGSLMVTLSPVAIALVSPNVKPIEVRLVVYGVAIVSPCTNAAVIAGEVVKDVAGIFPVAMVAAMVRSARFCALYLLTSHRDGVAPPAHAVAPVDHSNVHCVLAARAVQPAVKVTAAVTSPLLETAVVKVVVPHPAFMLGALLPATVQYGRVTTTLSPRARFCDTLKATSREVVEPWVAVPTSKVAVGKERSVVAVGVGIVVWTASAYWSAACWDVAILYPSYEEVRAVASTLVVWLLVVMVHAVLAASVAVATVKVTAAASAPELPTAVVKLVEPQPSVVGAQPVAVVGAQRPESVQRGRVTITLSPTARGELHLNAVATVVALPVIGVAITMLISEKVETAPTITPEFISPVTSSDLASFASTVRPGALTTEILLGTVMPVGILTVQSTWPSVAVFAVKVRLADDVPEPAATTPNSVPVPHPMYRRLAEVRAAPKTNSGRTRTKLSSSSMSTSSLNLK